MNQPLLSTLMIWILSVTFLSENFSVTHPLPHPDTHGQVSSTPLRRNVHHITGKTDDDDNLQKRVFFGPLGHIKSYNHVTDDGRRLDGSTNCTLQDDSADCSDLSLRSVPQNLPSNICDLNLEDNFIVDLPNYTFARYFALEYLDVSYNRIMNVEIHAFYNLSMLRELHIWGNRWSFQLPYPSHVFCPLKSLIHLDISSNNEENELPDLRYPDIALSCLTNLESLVIDYLPMNNQSPTFGDGFRNLTKLTSLNMDGLFLRHLNNYSGLYGHSFKNLERLESLSISNCNIQGNLISGKPFHNLKKLRKLDISGNPQIGIQNLQPIFDGLYHLENLTELNIGSTFNQYSSGHCLDVSMTKKLPPHLTTLRAQDNNIEAVDADVIDLLPTNLTTLDLRGNRFTIGAYMRQLHKLEQLTTLSLNGFTEAHSLPEFYPSDEGSLTPPSHKCTTFTNDSKPYLFVVSLPPKLVSLEMNNAGLNLNLFKLIVRVPNSLTHISVSGNHFPSFMGPVLGLHSLKYLNVSKCAVQIIDESFFFDQASLEVLGLEHNDLGHFLSNPENEDVFKRLRNLKTLDLSDNDLTDLPRGLFKNLFSLNSLYLRKNELVYFDIDLKSIVALSSLDLAHTRMFTLSIDTQAYFDNLVKNDGVNVSINMEYTPITCKCSNLQFLQWMTTSQAFFKPLHYYYCDFVYLRHPPVTDIYEETWTVLKRQCTSKGFLLFLEVSATLALSSLIIGAIVYRFRWNIRYLYYAVYLRFKKNSNALENERDYDAFICYASEDAEFAEHTLDRELSGRGLRIFLHGRDFKAGDYVSSNIVNAVCSSKKTVVLLTKALLDSYWCGYEIEMAKLEGINIGRPVLIFVLLEDIPKNKLSRDLLYNIKNNTYVEYINSASNPDQIRVWWDKLAKDIKD